MKHFIFFISMFFVFSTYSFPQFSQCPQPGLKIQSATCDSARNLKVASVSCSQLKVQWQGSQSQTYIVNATGNNVINNSIYQPTISNYSCDSKGNCQANILVKENSTINWSVQSTCTQNGGTLNSYAVNGKPVVIPACGKTNNSKSLVAYPNPTNRFLTVEYNDEVTENTRFTIYNASGKQMFSVSGNAITKTGNGYQFDLRNLTSGTYFLKLSNGDDVREVQFVLIKN